MSKLMLFDFACPKCETTFERLVRSKARFVKCSICRSACTRLISPSHIGNMKMGYDSSFPTASAKWERAQRHKARYDKGSLHGDRAPNLKMY